MENNIKVDDEPLGDYYDVVKDLILHFKKNLLGKKSKIRLNEKDVERYIQDSFFIIYLKCVKEQYPNSKYGTFISTHFDKRFKEVEEEKEKKKEREEIERQKEREEREEQEEKKRKIQELEQRIDDARRQIYELRN